MDTYLSPYALSSSVQPLGVWAYIVLILLSALEGPLVIITAGIASSLGYLNPLLVFLCGATGNLTADSLWYLLGYFGKTDWILRYGSWAGVKPEHIDRFKSEIQQHSQKILFGAKLSVWMIIPALIATGLAKVPWRKWIGAVALAECIWTGALVGISYYYGVYALHLDQQLKWVFVTLTVIFLGIFYFYFSQWRKRQEAQ